MTSIKINSILENYKSLSRDINKIEKKTLFLKKKKKELEEILIDYYKKKI